MGPFEDRFGFASLLEHIAFSKETIPLDRWRVIREKSALTGSCPNNILDLAGSFFRLDTWKNGNAAVESTPRGNRRGPVTPDYLADVKVDRVIELLEIPTAGLSLVPLHLEPPQSLDEPEGGLNCVNSASRLAHV